MNDLLTDLGTLAAVVLAATLTWAAIGKARSPRSSERAVIAFGVPRRLAPVVAMALPPTELAVAVMLIAVPRIGALVAVALLGAFSVAVLRVIRTASGDPVLCACFGAATAPVSPATLARNLVLVAAAAVTAVATNPVRQVPAFTSVVTMTSLAVIAAVAVSLTAMRNEIGAVWAMAIDRPSGSVPTGPSR